jgi:hypothetical protein
LHTTHNKSNKNQNQGQLLFVVVVTMSPAARLLAVVLLAAVMSCALASNIQVINKCGFNADVIYTANINERPLPSQNMGTLRPGYVHVPPHPRRRSGRWAVV